MDRIAPDAGYDFAAKKHYRRNVWAAFRRAYRGHMADKVFALMPSIEGAEIDVALQNGARESNLIIIDKNPAIVATLKRRYPKVTAYGVTAERAAERIANDFGEIHGVNLDLCGGADRPLFKTIAAWVNAGVLADESAVAITVLRGRESRGTFGTPTQVSAHYVAGHQNHVRLESRDSLRLSWIASALSGFDRRWVGKRMPSTVYRAAPYLVVNAKADTYKSAAGSQTMLYSIWGMHKQPCLCDVCVIDFRNHYSLETRDLTFFEAYSQRRSELAIHFGSDAVTNSERTLRESHVSRSESKRIYQSLVNARHREALVS